MLHHSSSAVALEIWWPSAARHLKYDDQVPYGTWNVLIKCHGTWLSYFKCRVALGHHISSATRHLVIIFQVPRHLMNDATLLCTIYIYGEHKPKIFEHFAAKRSKSFEHFAANCSNIVVIFWTLCGKVFKNLWLIFEHFAAKCSKIVVDFWTFKKMCFIFEHFATRCSKTCGCTIYVVCIH